MAPGCCRISQFILATAPPGAIAIMRQSCKGCSAHARRTRHLLTMRARKNGVRGAGAFRIRCGELARSRDSDWLSIVKILIEAGRWSYCFVNHQNTCTVVARVRGAAPLPASKPCPRAGHASTSGRSNRSRWCIRPGLRTRPRGHHYRHSRLAWLWGCSRDGHSGCGRRPVAISKGGA